MATGKTGKQHLTHFILALHIYNETA